MKTAFYLLSGFGIGQLISCLVLERFSNGWTALGCLVLAFIIHFIDRFIELRKTRSESKAFYRAYPTTL